jgi:hypothetical protein
MSPSEEAENGERASAVSESHGGRETLFKADEAKRRAVENLVVPSVVGASEIGALPNGRASAWALDAGGTPAVPVCTRPLPQAVLTTALGAGENNAIPVLAPAVPGAGGTPAVPVKALSINTEVNARATKFGDALATETKTASSASP